MTALKRQICLVGIVMCTILVVFYGVYIEPFAVDLHYVQIQDTALSHVLGQRVVVHLSDLHMNGMGMREQRVLGIVEKLQPDIILLTGDYVTWQGDYGAALDFLSRLSAKEGIWAVMGDYDYSNSRRSCLFCHEPGSGRPTRKHNVTFLQNQHEMVKLGGRSIGFAGMDGAENAHGTPLAVMKEAGIPLIVLSHSPLFFDQVPDDQSLLMLAGDTHGGQIPIPRWVFSMLGYEKNARYNEGLFVRGRKKMFVSRGIGTSHLQFRLFRKPEVVVLQFLE